MATIVNGADLADLKITPLDGGAFSISARCPLCRSLVSLRIDASDVEMNREVATECRSGGDWPRFFQLSARFSPSETDDESGLDVWGTIERDVHNEEYD